MFIYLVNFWSFFMKRLFIGNLSWKATEDLLKPLFEAFGAVSSVRIVTDQFTGKSRGFAFVEMDTAESAQKAAQELDNKPFMDRNLRVSLAHERTERKDSRGSAGSRGGGGYGGGNSSGGGYGGGGGGGGGGYGGQRRNGGQRFERNYTTD